MSLSRKIAAAVDSLTPDGTPPTAVTAEDGPHRLDLSVLHASRVGVEVEGLEFITTTRPEWTLDELRAWADRLAARVTYLMEPLVVVEVDAIGGEVELRSQNPTVRTGRRSFYEARLDRRGSLRLNRIAFDESSRQRQATPYQLTREVLEHLADDLVATATA